LRQYVIAGGILLIGWVSYWLTANSAKSRSSRPLSYKLRIYTAVLVVATFLAVGSAETLGTHAENCDPFGCARMTDFIPTANARLATGWRTFFTIIGPALVGAFLGLRAAVSEEAETDRLKAEEAANRA
jgi:hypothetical protein